MSKITLLLGFLCLHGFLFAQNPLPQGRSQFNAGLGFSDHGAPIYLGLDFGVERDISLGVELSVRAYRENWKNNRYNRSVIGIAGNGNYHFNRIMNIPRKWDFYAGLNIGFFIYNKPEDYDGDNTSGLGLGAQLGGRYYFSEKWGINLEFGGGNAFSNGKFGVSIKL